MAHQRRKLADLNLTSMMDMFSILLVFLLMSYSTDPSSSLSSSAKLPDSISEKQLQDKQRERTIAISIVKERTGLIEVMVKYKEDKMIVQYPFTERPNDKEKQELSKVTAFLRKHTKLAKKILVVEGDRNIPYRLLWTVLSSARDAGNIESIVMAVVSIQT